jgi:hypothetical protein
MQSLDFITQIMCKKVDIVLLKYCMYENRYVYYQLLMVENLPWLDIGEWRIVNDTKSSMKWTNV